MRRIMRAALVFSMLSVTCIAALAQPATAFNVFGYEVGADGISKAEQARDNAPDEREARQDERDTQQNEKRGLNRASEQTPEEAERGLERARERANVHAMVRFANNETYTRTALKDFAGDNYCIKTGERMACVNVADDGSIEMLDEKPDDYYEITTNEEFVARAWEKAQSGIPPTKQEFQENVKMPWRLRMKLVMNNMFS